MAGYEIIADVSRTLIELLRKKLTPEPIGKEELIGLCPPSEPGNHILGLNIYNIEEKKGLGTLSSVNLKPGFQKDPPTPLILYYMLTVHSKADLANSAIDQQRILGRAIQVLNDHGKLRGSYLQGSLKESNLALDITSLTLTMDDKAKIWTMYNLPYQLSIYYTVGPIYLDSDNIRQTTPVTEFQVDIRKVSQP